MDDKNFEKWAEIYKENGRVRKRFIASIKRNKRYNKKEKDQLLKWLDKAYMSAFWEIRMKRLGH